MEGNDHDRPSPARQGLGKRARSTNVHLTPDLERFARECVEDGRGNNISEVVRSGLRLLQAAEAKADRDESVSLDSVLAEVDDIIVGDTVFVQDAEGEAAGAGRPASPSFCFSLWLLPR